MAALTDVVSSGNAYVDGVLFPYRWSDADKVAMTFSFPTSVSFYGSASSAVNNNFRAFNATQKQAVRDILAMVSSFANLTFTEITEDATHHALLRYCESDNTATATTQSTKLGPGLFVTDPSNDGSRVIGIMIFRNTGNTFQNPVRGTYAWVTIAHETGHALGLKHAHDPAQGPTPSVAVPSDKDAIEWSIMSYRTYIGDDINALKAASDSFPWGFQPCDIAALQYMYGANMSGGTAGDTTYTVNPSTGEISINGVAQGAPVGNKVFTTIWDPRGTNTLDLSNFSPAPTTTHIPAQATKTSTAQVADLGNGNKPVGCIYNPFLYNGDKSSVLQFNPSPPAVTGVNFTKNIHP